MRQLVFCMSDSGGNVGVFIDISGRQQSLRQDIKPRLGGENQMLRLNIFWHKIFGDFRIEQSCKLSISHFRKQMDLVLLASVTKDIDDYYELLRGHAKHLALNHPLENPGACIICIARYIQGGIKLLDQL